MEAVDVCPEYPCGVKTTYRKYASDEVFEFVENKRVEARKTPKKLSVSTFPEEKRDESGNVVEPQGLYANLDSCAILTCSRNRHVYTAEAS